MRRRRVCVRRTPTPRLSSIACHHEAKSLSARTPEGPSAPAAWTSASGPTAASRKAAKSCLRLAHRERSQGNALAEFGRSWLQTSAVARHVSVRLISSIVACVRAARSSATARPIPRPAPVRTIVEGRGGAATGSHLPAGDCDLLTAAIRVEIEERVQDASEGEHSRPTERSRAGPRPVGWPHHRCPAS